MVQKTLYYETSNSLTHHGIKGQRWGVRRFQNKDGTLTAKGKKRYADGPEDISKMSNEELQSRINRMRNEKRYYELTKKQSGFSKFTGKLSGKTEDGSKFIKTAKKDLKKAGLNVGHINKAVEGVDTVSKSAAVANKISNLVEDKANVKNAKERVRKMSDAELDKIVKRMDLEKQYSDISKETRERGKVTVEKVMPILRDTGALIITGVAIGSAIKKLFDFGVKGDLLEDLKVPGM